MNIEFKRAIAQAFDPETDYSDFDEAEVEGAFEATVYQLLLERQGSRGAGEQGRINSNSSSALDFGSIIHQVIKWNNLDIGLEYRPGEVRFPGRRNSRKLRCGYGHFRGYREDSTGEAPDVYLAPSFFDGGTPSDRLFKIAQLSPEDGDYDEPKYMAGFLNEDDAKSAYLREMPADYFGGIEEVLISDLDQYRKPQAVDYSEAITLGLQPYLQKLDELADKIDNLSARFTEFTAPIKIEGAGATEEELEAIASNISLDDAIEDWKENMPDKVKSLIGE
ncbi:hypothetical protein [Aulosira sp. FACHB-615]|uniref:hypothetical protein n=1 Tax=Aulosira sp. FACHB-615 TaxID=2692777 RepID=UPI0016864F96|nr:hypothetical protein [Aulosira sp. FACHB-615]MBD2492537.1 hypothetical protein [Aulosira sp. FACHB-615]